jgi:hypothetical protein
VISPCHPLDSHQNQQLASSHISNPSDSLNDPTLIMEANPTGVGSALAHAASAQRQLGWSALQTFPGDHFDSFNKNIQAYVHNSHKICDIQASLDTQADGNVMAERIAKQLGYQIDTSQTTTFESIGKSTVRSIGKVSLNFRLVDFDEWWTDTFHILGNQCETHNILLGKAFISRAGLLRPRSRGYGRPRSNTSHM